MTRRGSLVYYLASWICGGLFLTVAMYLQERASPEGMGIGPTGAGAAIITTYFLVLIFCAFLSFVFAFLLRLSMRWLHAEALWQWVLAGILLAQVLALLHGFACITHRGNQVVSGVAINILAAGLTIVFGVAWFRQGGQTPPLPPEARFMPISWPGAAAPDAVRGRPLRT